LNKAVTDSFQGTDIDHFDVVVRMNDFVLLPAWTGIRTDIQVLATPDDAKFPVLNGRVPTPTPDLNPDMNPPFPIASSKLSPKILIYSTSIFPVTLALIS